MNPKGSDIYRTNEIQKIRPFQGRTNLRQYWIFKFLIASEYKILEK
jgi:hypothetical protein